MAATTQHRYVSYGPAFPFTFIGVMPSKGGERQRQQQREQPVVSSAVVRQVDAGPQLRRAPHTSGLPRHELSTAQGASISAPRSVVSSVRQAGHSRRPEQPSSFSEPFHCPSARNTLLQHAASSVTNIPQFQLLVRQHPQHGVAQGASERAYKSTRFTPLDPPPVCELVTSREVDARFLSCVEVSVRACLVSADAPYSEVGMPTAHKLSKHSGAPLIGTRVESAFIAPCIKQQDECFFIFTDVGVRRSGQFRLRFDLIDRVDVQFTHLTSVYSNVFDVVDDKKNFAGLTPSSELIHAIARRGLRLRIISRPSTTTTTTTNTDRQSMTSSGTDHYDGDSDDRKRRKLVDVDQRLKPIPYAHAPPVSLPPRLFSPHLSTRHKTESSIMAGVGARVRSDSDEQPSSHHHPAAVSTTASLSVGRPSPPVAHLVVAASSENTVAYRPVLRLPSPQMTMTSPSLSGGHTRTLQRPSSADMVDTAVRRHWRPTLNLSPRYDVHYPSRTDSIGSTPVPPLHSATARPLDHHYSSPTMPQLPLPISQMTASGRRDHHTATVPDTQASDNYWQQQYRQQQQRLDEFRQRRDGDHRHAASGGSQAPPEG